MGLLTSKETRRKLSSCGKSMQMLLYNFQAATGYSTSVCLSSWQGIHLGEPPSREEQLQQVIYTEQLTLESAWTHRLVSPEMTSVV